jgi:hypothetical protein
MLATSSATWLTGRVESNDDSSTESPIDLPLWTPLARVTGRP